MSDQATPAPQTDDRTVTAAAPSIVQSMAAQPPVSPQPQVSSRAKEAGSISASETVPIIEVGSGASAIEKEPLPPEVEAWMEKVGSQGKEVSQMDNLPPVTLQQAPAAQSAPSSHAFVLPLGEEEVKKGANAGVNDSIKWLAFWCLRLIKQLKGQAVYRGS